MRINDSFSATVAALAMPRSSFLSDVSTGIAGVYKDRDNREVQKMTMDEIKNKQADSSSLADFYQSGKTMSQWTTDGGKFVTGEGAKSAFDAQSDINKQLLDAFKANADADYKTKKLGIDYGRLDLDGQKFKHNVEDDNIKNYISAGNLELGKSKLAHEKNKPLTSAEQLSDIKLKDAGFESARIMDPKFSENWENLSEADKETAKVVYRSTGKLPKMKNDGGFFGTGFFSDFSLE